MLDLNEKNQLEVKAMLEAVNAKLIGQIIEQKQKEAKRLHDDRYEELSQKAGFDSDDDKVKEELNKLKFKKDVAEA